MAVCFSSELLRGKRFYGLSMGLKKRVTICTVKFGYLYQNPLISHIVRYIVFFTAKDPYKNSQFSQLHTLLPCSLYLSAIAIIAVSSTKFTDIILYLYLLYTLESL